MVCTRVARPALGTTPARLCSTQPSFSPPAEQEDQDAPEGRQVVEMGTVPPRPKEDQPEDSERQEETGGVRRLGAVSSNLHSAPAEARQEPEPPAESECCGTGCDDCVWVQYWERLQDYQAKKAALEKQQSNP